MSDIASIAADLNAALVSGNSIDLEKAQAAYAAFVAEGVDVESITIEDEDDLESGIAAEESGDLDVPGASVEGVDFDAIADAELGDS